ncbi:MAG: SAM-dependent methyltransferase [Bacteroidales bacterium]|nr:SAM-dependent methyltransferase [Bacteroidales bacterium]MCF8334553.1 SAM-dependent methyltransferase [Bacteroidales bacterium]
MIEIKSIGQIKKSGDQFLIEIDNKYLQGLKGLEGFSHAQIVWWGHLSDKPEQRNSLVARKLFKKGPDKMGTFATRAPARPNPILTSTIKIVEIDKEKGVIFTPFIDAEPGTPVLDIKPYFPMERVKNCKAPQWCEHWPKWAEEAAGFDWSKEINF